MRYRLQLRIREMLKRIPRRDFTTNLFRTTFVRVVQHGHLGFDAGVAEATRVMRDILGYSDFTPRIDPPSAGVADRAEAGGVATESASNATIGRAGCLFRQSPAVLFA